ncbi:prophage antirepressor-like protein [Streptomyces phaeochromogenes]|uniref:BRO-N domain-containing protein n=1 Tax=Streptomyces phaeochromogenes TaxID=1923 RepID=UPI002790190D|nr:Bro-N domain-containing protein [Streptomyces phaeochromogenes]MDQ0951168.1 prophage antirepressor-like protein [Streptomyces phaeochromogenes]
MYEQNNMPPNSATAPRQDAIDINDFVFAATGARMRRLTTPDGEHWFPATDLAGNLGYANTRQALQMHVAANCQKRLSEFAQGVYTADTLSKLAGHRLQKSMKMVNLKGLVALVNGCTKPECAPFKAWVTEVIETLQHTGSYSLEPAPVQPTPDGATAYVMPQQIADAIVRLEERNIRADELLLAFQEERGELLRQISRSQSDMAETQRRISDSQNVMAEALQQIAEALKPPHGRPRPTTPPEPEVTPQQLLATWKAKNLVVTGDVHAVAAYLAPALLRGGARYRLEEIATRTGLPQERVHDCVRMLLKRGCVRQTGCAPDGAPLYVLP